MLNVRVHDVDADARGNLHRYPLDENVQVGMHARMHATLFDAVRWADAVKQPSGDVTASGGVGVDQVMDNVVVQE